MGKDCQLLPPHKNAWITMLVASRVLLKGLDTAMVDAGCVPLEIYDVLLFLEEAPEHRLRMAELAECVLLSRSGITRLVDRMQTQGLLVREMDSVDRRGTFAVIAELGLKRRAEAWPIMKSHIANHFASRMSNEEARALHCILGRFFDDRRIIGYEADNEPS